MVKGIDIGWAVYHYSGMNSETQKELESLLSRIRERNAANERDLYKAQRILRETEPEGRYYPFEPVIRFLSYLSHGRGFVYFLIGLAAITVIFTLFSEVPGDTP